MKRKLTKIVKKRRLNYKPTMGLTLSTGERVSVNTIKHYADIKVRTQLELKKMSRVVHKTMREMFPGIALIQDMCEAMGGWGFYF